MGVQEREGPAGALVGYVGTAVDQEQSGVLYGFLLIINSRGEPVEFCWSAAKVPNETLWGEGLARRVTSRKLAVRAIEVAAAKPALFLFRGSDFPAGMLGDDLRSDDTNLGRVTLVAAPEGAAEGAVAPASKYALNLVNNEDETSRALLTELGRRGLFWEPFDRGEKALRELLAVEGRPDL